MEWFKSEKVSGGAQGIPYGGRMPCDVREMQCRTGRRSSWVGGGQYMARRMHRGCRGDAWVVKGPQNGVLSSVQEVPYRSGMVWVKKGVCAQSKGAVWVGKGAQIGEGVG